MPPNTTNQEELDFHRSEYEMPKQEEVPQRDTVHNAHLIHLRNLNTALYKLITTNNITVKN